MRERRIGPPPPTLYNRVARGLEVAPTPWEKFKRAGKVLVREARVPTGSLRFLPQFLIIGAQKAGTSSLYHYLSRHPDVAAAFTKEPHYFDRHFDRGTTWYRSHFPLLLRRPLHARRTGRELLTGEATPDYLFQPHAPTRAHGLLPDARLVVLLRDPVDRAISHYHHQRLRGRENLPLREAMEAEADRLSGEDERVRDHPSYYPYAFEHFSYLRRGLYATQLRRWFEHYPREQVLVLQSEEFFSGTARLYREVLDFLALPEGRSTRFPPRNTGSYSPPAGNVAASLRDHFRQPNEELFELLGRRLDWG